MEEAGTSCIVARSWRQGNLFADGRGKWGRHRQLVVVLSKYYFGQNMEPFINLSHHNQLVIVFLNKYERKWGLFFTHHIVYWRFPRNIYLGRIRFLPISPEICRLDLSSSGCYPRSELPGSFVCVQQSMSPPNKVKSSNTMAVIYWCFIVKHFICGWDTSTKGKFSKTSNFWKLFSKSSISPAPADFHYPLPNTLILMS
jgi:hypothetical protein